MINLLPPATTLALYFTPDLPKTFQALLEEHLEYKLEDYKGVSKRSWGNALAMSYSQHLYMYWLVIEKATKLHSGNDMAFKLQEAARQLDEERGTMSMYKLYESKKASDVKRQKRKIMPVKGGRNGLDRLTFDSGVRQLFFLLFLHVVALV